jgi:hypothetical protein
MLFLADKERRPRFSMSLLLHLPYYVTAGRYLDGWLIQECASQTVELDRDSNSFLFEMYSHGYNAVLSAVSNICHSSSGSSSPMEIRIKWRDSPQDSAQGSSL